MRSSAILWAALVLALVVVLTLLPRSHSPTAGAVSVEEGEKVLDAPTLESRTPVIEQSTPRSSPASASRRDAIEPSSPAPTCRIRVIEAATKAAVPDARVWIQREDAEVDSVAWSRAMSRSNDVEEALRSGLGDEVALDERAEAFVPRPARAR